MIAIWVAQGVAAETKGKSPSQDVFARLWRLCVLPAIASRRCCKGGSTTHFNSLGTHGESGPTTAYLMQLAAQDDRHE